MAYQPTPEILYEIKNLVQKSTEDNRINQNNIIAKLKQINDAGDTVEWKTYEKINDVNENIKEDIIKLKEDIDSFKEELKASNDIFQTNVMKKLDELVKSIKRNSIEEKNIYDDDEFHGEGYIDDDFGKDTRKIDMYNPVRENDSDSDYFPNK